MVICGIFSNCKVFAESKTLSIYPSLNYFVRENQEYEDLAITVENPSEKDLNLKVYTASYAILNNGSETSFDDKYRTDFNDIANWIVFKNDEGQYEKTLNFILEKNSEKNIDFRVNLENSEQKEQYCAIFIETIPDGSDDSDNSSLRLVSLVVAHNDEMSENSKITDFSSNAFAVQNFSAETDTKVIYDYTISSVFGKTIYTDSAEKVVFPESSKSFSFFWSEMPEFGIFKEKLVISISQESKEAERIVFKMPVILKIIIFSLLTFIIFMLIIKHKNRKGCGNSSVQNKHN